MNEPCCYNLEGKHLKNVFFLLFDFREFEAFDCTMSKKGAEVNLQVQSSRNQSRKKTRFLIAVLDESDTLIVSWRK